MIRVPRPARIRAAMPTEIDELRDLARAYWSGRPIPCPKHPGAMMTGSFAQTTFADHVFLSCPKGREAITIPQRPRQLEFQDLQVDVRETPVTGFAEYTFTCVRCLSSGTWAGIPAMAKIGK